MKTQLFAIFYVIGIIMLFQACTVKYVPNVLNTPMFSKAGEVNMVANFGESGFDPQLSASVTDHIGIMLNGSFWDQSGNSTNYTSHTFMELGAGYFTKLKIARFEVYGGYGLGNFYSQYYYTPIFTDTEGHLERSDADCNRFFIQPGIGLSTEHFEMSLASRFVNVNFFKDTDTGNSLKGIPFFFLEPALTLKAGFKNVKGVFQIGTSILLNNDTYVEYDPFIVSFGLQLSLDAFVHQQKKTIENIEVNTDEVGTK